MPSHISLPRFASVLQPFTFGVELSFSIPHAPASSVRAPSASPFPQPCLPSSYFLHHSQKRQLQRRNPPNILPPALQRLTFHPAPLLPPAHTPTLPIHSALRGPSFAPLHRAPPEPPHQPQAAALAARHQAVVLALHPLQLPKRFTPRRRTATGLLSRKLMRRRAPVALGSRAFQFSRTRRRDSNHFKSCSEAL
jgi:hypothetical protein